MAQFFTNKYFSKRILSQGDDILLRCQYSSLHLNAPTFGGTESSNELCFAIITYVENEEINRNDRFNRFGSTGRQVLFHILPT